MHPESPEAYPELAGVLAEQAAEPDDPELASALERASKQPDVPDSLRRVARRVAQGQLSWRDVLRGSADPDVLELRRQASNIAQQHSADLRLVARDSDQPSEPGGSR